MGKIDLPGTSSIFPLHHLLEVTHPSEMEKLHLPFAVSLTLFLGFGFGNLNSSDYIIRTNNVKKKTGIKLGKPLN